MITGRRGWYQEEGMPAQELHPVDVVEMAPNVKHLHGTAADSWFVHLTIEGDVTVGPSIWM
ncbi:cupin domain-containing protein [Bacillus cihuensis]|uniref:hypothetical protein n=1 Tax=Bacillus cihuensis TaxID=1208599 RepID=UPI000410B803|nr:hypothetical protein [Bacillus cihuensis]